MKWIRIIVCTIICSVAAALCMGNVHAEGTESSLTFGPTSQRISLKPGETYRSSVIVSNPAMSENDLKFQLYVAPYSVANDDYDPVFDKVGTYTQIVDWITLDKIEGTLKPNDSMEIGFTVKVPEDVPAGGQYAAIVAQDVTSFDGTNNSGVQISSISAVASVVVADVAGQTREYGEVFENNMPTFVMSAPFVASAGVKNTGNVHTDAKSVLQVWPLFSDEEIYTNEESDDNGKLVLPDTTRYFFNTWGDVPAIGIFRAKQTVTIFGETSVNEKIIVICPLWLLFIVIFLIALLLICFVTVIIKKVRKSKAKEAKAE